MSKLALEIAPKEAVVLVGRALVDLLVLRVSIGGGNHLPLGVPSARLTLIT